MKLAVNLLLLAVLFTFGRHAAAQDLPQELFGQYQGTFTETTVGSKTKTKFAGTLTINNGTDVLLTTEDSSLPGDISLLADNICVLKFEGSPIVFLSGTGEFKGKPGKTSLKGTLYLVVDGVAGISKTTYKVKQGPIPR